MLHLFVTFTFVVSLVAVVIAFTICWLPFHTQRLLFLYVTLYGEWSVQLRDINQILFLTAGKPFIRTESCH